MSPSSAPDPSGQVLFIGIDGTVLTRETSELLRRTRPGGIIIFKRNVDTLEGLAALCRDLHAAIDPSPLLAIDEEGGRVTRLKPHLPDLPAAASIAGAGPDRLREYWRSYGTLLASLGFDIDFAPVVDLCPPDAPNGIADRSFGTDPRAVVQCATAVIEGLEAAGVLPTLKHFPGLGNTLLDSHHHLPTISTTREAFEREDLIPFVELKERAPSVMVGHAHYPFYSGADPLAATLSAEVCTTLLRDRIGYRGVAISDDLEMKAVAARVAWDELAPRSVEAGCDMLLICHRADRVAAAHDALRRRAEKDPAFARRLEEASGRVQAMRALSRPRSVPPERASSDIGAAREALLASAGRIAAPQA